MRKKGVIQAGKCYHLVSRVAHRAYFLDDEIKAQFGGSGAGSGFGELLASYARRMFHPSEFMNSYTVGSTLFCATYAGAFPMAPQRRDCKAAIAAA